MAGDLCRVLPQPGGPGLLVRVRLGIRGVGIGEAARRTGLSVHTYVLGGGLGGPTTAATSRLRDGQLQVAAGPFLELESSAPGQTGSGDLVRDRFWQKTGPSRIGGNTCCEN